ncbi:actin related protein 2/3 complex, subunit 4 [Acrasis kona]|uniref:Actin-related protein 2/3 complex subunit 4 n=1 Tax=Acrasis kona TaxID=1008807 RepID=A0AAW2YP70_9EUKA
MATNQIPYIDCIKTTLEAALCLENFPSQIVERHNKPEVEAGTSKELLLNPVVITREKYNRKNLDGQDEVGFERVMVEGSINSIRVSISFRKSDEAEKILSKRYMRFLTQRAEDFYILRRKPVEGYDISFLITNFHAEQMFKDKLIKFILDFIQDIDKDVKDMKIQQNVRARLVAKKFLGSFL